MSDYHYVSHIPLTHLCPLILYVNRQYSVQNRVIVQPAAVNPSIVAKHEIAMRGLLLTGLKKQETVYIQGS